MKRKLLCITVFFLVMIGTAGAVNPEVFKAQSPIFLTSFGQNPDTNFLNLLSKKLKLDYDYETAVRPEDIDWNKYKTLIAVIGGSGKGLGAAGLDINSELERCEKILADAENAGATIIGMHIGGEDRRGPNSEPFLPLAGKVDYLVVKSSGNADGYFTDLASAKNIPLYIVDTTSEIQKLLQEIFF